MERCMEERRDVSLPGGRRDFLRAFALGGSAALFARAGFAWPQAGELPAAPGEANEGYWQALRREFVMPPEIGVLNAANLCPSTVKALEAMVGATRDMDRDPSFPNRAKLTEGKEVTRRLLSEFLRASPEEIVITRNTSEGNNFVSSGLDLKPGDEVVVFSDNHPSNLAAWKEKAKRFGFVVRVVEQVNPHPGFEHYLDAFAKAMSARTRVLAFSHVTSTVGDQLPAKELCRMARERDVLTLVDGAQSFGLLEVDLGDMQPDFYTGSGHKWPCGPKEVGVLYIHRRAQAKIWPSIVSVYPGAVGVSKTFEGFGQRDEPAIVALGEALKLQMKVGRKRIEERSQELLQMARRELEKLDGVKIWTSPDPSRARAVVSFQPGSLDPFKLAAALYEKDRIGCATRAPGDRGGIRFAPHFYNLPSEIERAVAAVKRCLATGV